MFSPNVNNTIKNRLPLGRRFYEFVVSYSFFIIPQGSSPCAKLLLTLSCSLIIMSSDCVFLFCDWQVASYCTTIGVFVLLHRLTFTEPRHYGGVFLYIKKRTNFEKFVLFHGVSAGARTRTGSVGGSNGIQFHHGHILYFYAIFSKIF